MSIPCGNFRITDLVELCEDPNDGVNLGLGIATFWMAQKAAANPANDAILDTLQCPKIAALPLITVLSTIDPIFFDLSARVAANALVKSQGNIGPIVGYLAAVRLTYPKPQIKRSTIARDIGLLYGLANTCRMGISPTEKNSKKPNAPEPDSGSRRLYDMLENEGRRPHGTPDITQIGKVWGRRVSILKKAGFQAEDVSLFTERFKGTT